MVSSPRPLDSGRQRHQRADPDRTAMQLLTHPIWWTEEPVEDRMVLLDRFLGERAQVLHREARDNCKRYAARASGRTQPSA